ncbi:MAG: LacI family DNA-binding transcriptional regulator, partial [Bacteroidota bacterium]
VLNNSDDVSDHTRNRVLKAIETLQFRPQRTAKALAQKKTRLVAIAIPTFTTPFHSELLSGVRHYLRNEEIDLLLCDLGSRAPYQKLLNFLKRGTVDGLLLAGLPIDEKLEVELKAMYAPVVLVGNRSGFFDSYYWDDISGARLAVRHLIEQGHTKIGMIRAFTESDFQMGRVAGYREALEGAGLPFNETFVASGTTEKHGGFSEEAGYEAMKKLLEEAPELTAVFASSDVQAFGAIKALHEAGKRIPDDLALIGYDDIKVSAFVGLSSIDQNMFSVGQDAMKRLFDRLDAETPTEDRIDALVQPMLRVRRSTNTPLSP